MSFYHFIIIIIIFILIIIIVVIALTSEGCYICGKYEDGCWKSIDGKVFDQEDIYGPVVAWFYIPALHKINK